jgi:hypothetical protein
MKEKRHASAPDPNQQFAAHGSFLLDDSISIITHRGTIRSTYQILAPGK